MVDFFSSPPNGLGNGLLEGDETPPSPLASGEQPRNLQGWRCSIPSDGIWDVAGPGPLFTWKMMTT